MVKLLNDDELRVAIGDIFQNIKDDKVGQVNGWDGANYDPVADIIELIEDQKKAYLQHEMSRSKED